MQARPGCRQSALANEGLHMNHKGGCHCGRIAFTVEGEVGRAIECNCSMCRRRGSLLAFFPLEAFTLTGAVHNSGPSSPTSAQLTVAVPEGAAFLSRPGGCPPDDGGPGGFTCTGALVAAAVS